MAAPLFSCRFPPSSAAEENSQREKASAQPSEMIVLILRTNVEEHLL